MRRQLSFRVRLKNNRFGSTPESNSVPQVKKGENIMGYMNAQILHLLYRFSRAVEVTPAWIYRLCRRIKFCSIGISLIPGIITCKIGLRAGGPGQIYY